MIDASKITTESDIIEALIKLDSKLFQRYNE